MNEVKKERINAFLNDDLMVEAVKEVIMSVTEIDLSKFADFDGDDNRLGEEIRALAKGKELVNQGFNKLLEFRKRETKQNSKNPAI